MLHLVAGLPFSEIELAALGQGRPIDALDVAHQSVLPFHLFVLGWVVSFPFPVIVCPQTARFSVPI